MAKLREVMTREEMTHCVATLVGIGCALGPTETRVQRAIRTIKDDFYTMDNTQIDELLQIYAIYTKSDIFANFIREAMGIPERFITEEQENNPEDIEYDNLQFLR